MDKRDVEMEDAYKQPHDHEEDGLLSQIDDVDVQLKGEGQDLPHSSIQEANKPSEIGAEEQEKDKISHMIDQTTARSGGVDVLRNTGCETEDPSQVKTEVSKEGENIDNVKSDEAKSEMEEQINNKNEVDVHSKTDTESKEENPTDNGEQNDPGKFLEEQNRSENSIEEKNSSEQVLIANEAPDKDTGMVDEAHQSKDKAEVVDNHLTDNRRMVEADESKNKTASATAVTGGDTEMGETLETKSEGGVTDPNLSDKVVDMPKDSSDENVTATVADGNINLGATPIRMRDVDDTVVANHNELATPRALVKCQSTKAGSHSEEAYRNLFDEAKLPGDEDGTSEEQAAFMRELETFYRERATEFKPPRFYGQQLNCLKLWRAVIRLGGYDRVTGSKLWRHVGESFHPPKTCTTVSWTFRIFYEKALLEFERYKRDSGDLQLPLLALPDPSSVDNEGNGHQASGSGRQRRDAAARAMQGWHTRLFGNGEAGEPTIKDKDVNNLAKPEKNLKSIGSIKQKRPNEVEQPVVKAARPETSRQLVTSVVDVGPAADWVKINVRETKECFEVYALVPGLLREEVRVQSDPAGRVVITGQPEQPDNPWGITAFKKVVSLPARIDPLNTSAVVSLHGRLFVRVPFEQSNI